MAQTQPTKSKKSFFIGLIVGFIVYGILKELIWPLIFS